MLERSFLSNRSTLVTQGVRMGCKAVSVLALARLLTPADHGLYAMAASVTLLLLLFRDLGFGTAAVQAPSLDERQLATLWWIHFGLGVTLALVTLSLAPLARQFYATEAVQPLLMVMSPSFLLLGAGGLARSQLAREVRFSELNQIETIAAVVGTIAMIVAAALGAGAYAFATFLLVSETLNAALAWRAWGWQPRRSFALASVRSLFKTGTDLTAYAVLGHATQQLDTFVIGQAFGPRTLGLYSRSALLLALPGLHIATPFTQVALATLSRLGPDAPQFHEHACRTAMLIGYLCLPLAVICIVLPHDVVGFVLGAQWPEAAPMLRWLAVSAAVAMVTSLAYGINVATGRTRQLVASMIFILPVTVLAIYLGFNGGATGVAAALAVANLILAVPRLHAALRGSPVTIGAYASALGGPFTAAAALAIGLVLGARLAADTSIAARILVTGAAGLGSIALLALSWRRLRHELRYVWAHLPWSRPVTIAVSPP